MNDRDTIFSRIRQALDPLPERTSVPEYDASLMICRAPEGCATDRAIFAERLRLHHANLLESVEAVAELLRKENALSGYCDPALLGQFQNSAFEGITFHPEFDIADYERYQFGITRATAIAETGSVMMKDAVTSSRLAALSPWLHIAVVNEKELWPNVPEAIEQFGDDPNIVWATGPSKTADVEGILIEGVHGPGIQAVWLVND